MFSSRCMWRHGQIRFNSNPVEMRTCLKLSLSSVAKRRNVSRLTQRPPQPNAAYSQLVWYAACVSSATRNKLPLCSIRCSLPDIISTSDPAELRIGVHASGRHPLSSASFPFPFVPLQRQGCLVAPLFL
jgi:hypothetical protein